MENKTLSDVIKELDEIKEKLNIVSQNLDLLNSFNGSDHAEFAVKIYLLEQKFNNQESNGK